MDEQKQAIDPKCDSSTHSSLWCYCAYSRWDMVLARVALDTANLYEEARLIVYIGAQKQKSREIEETETEAETDE
ncbi:unnamed protein product [Cylicocyclus nassatus]|uniref:Uncharacterized protein n=1 Tax=Cylicocyclus nassatus TaxID=53992 RepID=A0AA36M6Y3_CYLNA|nr:unnamed protein product [Cylicocyclus nassatus]